MALDISFLKKRQTQDHGVMKNSLIIGITTVLANLFMYIFYLQIAQKLGPEKYGVFGSLLSIYFIVFFLTNIMNYIVIQYVSYFKAKIQYDKIRRLFDILTKTMAVIGFCIFLFLLALSNRLKAFIGYDSTTPIIFLGLFLWAYIVLATVFGFLNGMQKFISLGMSRVIDSFFTLLFGIIFLSLDMEISGGMLALFFAALLTIPFAIVPLKSIINIQPAKIGEVGMVEYIVKTLIPSIFIAIMLNVDVILVKMFFDDAHAGYFAAASLMGKIVFFISTGILTVIFPKVAELHNNGEDTSPLLKDGIVYTIILGGTTTLLYFLFPGFFAHILFSRDYQIDSLIGVYALSTTFLSLVNVFVMYNMAIRKFGIAFIVTPFTALLVTAIAIFHSSLFQVLLIMSLVMFLMLLGIIYFSKEDFLKMFRKPAGYRKYPISAYLRLKTTGMDENTSSKKIKVKEYRELISADDLKMFEDEEERKSG